MERALRMFWIVGMVATMLTSVTAPTVAQTPAPATATDFYLQYRKVFEAAKKIDELLPYMSADTRKSVETTPPDQRAEMFEMVKMMGEMTNLKVIKEVRAGSGATLTVTGLGMDKTSMTGTISIVKEGGAFKLGKESWTSK